MNLAWTAAGAVAGLPAGTVLRSPVFRLSVPSGEPERITCQHCGAPVPRWIALRCTYCGRAFGTPIALELVCAAVLALLLARFGARPPGSTQNRWLFATWISRACRSRPGALVRALLGGVALAGGYLILAMLRAGQLGGGDIKLAGLVGLALGWLGWRTLYIGASLGFVLAAIVGVVLLATRRATMRTAISFGPYLLGGALLAIIAS